MHQRGKLVATACVAGALFLAGGLPSAAQDASPAAGGDDHPAHIHVGTCDNLDPNPTFMLTNVMLLPGATPGNGDSVAIPVERSVTTVDAPLDKLATGGYAVNIHRSAADIGTYIACGSLTGSPDENGPLVVGLRERNDSGHSGIAILTSNGNQTDVSIYLAQGLSGVAGTAAAGGATPAASAPAQQNAATVDITNIAYDPATIEIPVGGTVTWTNSDPVPHTATGKDRSLLQSGTIAPGASFSQTFDKAGTIDYFCEFHANMKGTIVVK